MKKNHSDKRTFSIKIMILIFTLVFIIILLLSNFFIIYYLEFIKSLKSENELLRNVFSFLEGKENLSSDFSERELVHLNDVKNLIKTTKIFFVLIIVIELFIFLYIKRLKGFNSDIFIKNFIYFLFVIAFIILILILFINKNFNSAFSIFHLLFFKPDTWIFNSDDLIITLFPEHYFRSLGLKIFGLLLLEIIFTIIILFMIKSFSFKRKNI